MEELHHGQAGITPRAAEEFMNEYIMTYAASARRLMSFTELGRKVVTVAMDCSRVGGVETLLTALNYPSTNLSCWGLVLAPQGKVPRN